MGKTDIKFTPQQQAAIKNRGGSLLVSAAAGSGKTRVLVERLLSYITDESAPCGIDAFLVITYTKAAAAELRGKILDEISRRLAADPFNAALRRQSHLCYRAQIGTIHSFCAGLLRENAQLLEISPDFRVADEGESGILKAHVLDVLLEEKYETIVGGSGFSLLVDTMSAGRDDAKLAQIVLETHSKLQSHPYPERWVEEQRRRLTLPMGIDAAETVWGQLLLQRAAAAARYWARRLDEVLQMADETFFSAYGESLRETLDGIERFCAAAGESWDAAFAASDIHFPKVRPVKGYEEWKAVRTRCKKELERITGIFDCGSALLLEDMRAAAPAVQALFDLVLEFDCRYAAEKRRRKLIDFSDQEHMAVRLLVDRETGERTPLAAEISHRYREIMVDEYQDVNAVQELIFSALSAEQGNLFMVGDVKQSIYRFRLADPSIFLRKYRSFEEADTAVDGQSRRIILSRNFRSRAAVLDAVNYVFQNVMSEDFGEMAYTEREYLYPGAVYPGVQEPAVELDVLDMRGLAAEEDAETPEKTDCEATFVAHRIRELVGQPIVTENGVLRPARYGDFTILLRSANSKGGRYAAALQGMGIPVAADGGVDFFRAVEVSILISLLSVVDNPRQDVPLISVLRSPVYGFTPDELAEIRAVDGESDFYDALCSAAETNEKCARFLDMLNGFREMAADMTVRQLIWHIYSVTGMLAVMGAMHGGEQRKRNLMLFLEYAETYERAGYKGLYSFITYVRELMARGETPSVPAAASEDAVQIMSIHKSKGLEFPIVILADMAKKFNSEDIRRPLLIHAELGVGPKRLLPEARLEYTTLARRAIAVKAAEEMLAEELRVLYVAMTRAREKLILVAAYRDAERELERLRPDAALPLDPQVLLRARSMADWVLLPAMLRPEGGVLRGASAEAPSGGLEAAAEQWSVRLVDAAAPAADMPPADVDDGEKMPSSGMDVGWIAARLEMPYLHFNAVNIPSKLTATQAKGIYGGADPDAVPLEFLREAPAIRRPDFKKKRQLSGAEKGTALHTVLQLMDVTAGESFAAVSAEIARLRTRGVLSEEEAAAVPAEKIFAFFQSPLGQKLQTGERLYREFHFSVLLPAEDFFAGGGLDEILVQGAVDCCVEMQTGLILIDFKTDRVFGDAVFTRAEFYRPQLRVYEKAMARILKKPVLESWLYFFAPGEGIKL